MSERRLENERDASHRHEEAPQAPVEPGTETNELALFSLFLGIFWVFGFGSLAAIYLGWKALREIGDDEQRERGSVFAWTGIATGFFGLASTGLIIVVALKPG